MTRHPAVTIAALALLAGCAGAAHQADDSFLRTQQLARFEEPDAQLDLARMYADPAAFPQAAAVGLRADPAKAAEWCLIAASLPPATPEAQARGPSCAELLTTLPPLAVAQGRYQADQWLGWKDRIWWR